MLGKVLESALLSLKQTSGTSKCGSLVKLNLTLYTIPTKMFLDDIKSSYPIPRNWRNWVSSNPTWTIAYQMHAIAKVL